MDVSQMSAKVSKGNSKVRESILPALDDESQERLTQFRNAYPVKRRTCNPRELATLWADLSVPEQQQAIASLPVLATSAEWTDDGGRYIPGIVKFLTNRAWESVAVTAGPMTQAKLQKLLFTDFVHKGLYRDGDDGFNAYKADYKAGTLPQLDGSRT
jgi:hypothetical protein